MSFQVRNLFIWVFYIELLQRDGIGELIWDPNGILNRPSGSHTSKGRDHDPALTRDPETSLRPKRRETALATFFITLKENWDLSNNS